MQNKTNTVGGSDTPTPKMFNPLTQGSIDKQLKRMEYDTCCHVVTLSHCHTVTGDGGVLQGVTRNDRETERPDDRVTERPSEVAINADNILPLVPLVSLVSLVSKKNQ